MLAGHIDEYASDSVEVKNQGGDFNKIGFANPTFYK